MDALLDFENYAKVAMPSALVEQYSPIHFHAPTVAGAAAPTVALTPKIERMIAEHKPCVVSVSGGKDSMAVALAVRDYLDAVGHKGPRVLMHADLGVVEWKDSLPSCERLAAAMGWELVTVRRAAGDMLDRWRGRWAANVKRYAALDCVTLILPWSTPALRFCTSELKSGVMASEMKKMFPGQDVLSVSGIRHEESSSRAKMPIAQVNTRMQRKDSTGVTWNAIIHWSIQQVFDKIAASGLTLHEAYTRYNMTRVSCAFCIMSNEGDMVNAASCEDNQQLYRDMVDLELASGFGFQGSRWLADVAPHLLTPQQLERVALVKGCARRRVVLEKGIPKHLLFTKGFPTAMPTHEEAKLLADVRVQVSQLVGIEIGFTEPEAIMQRYADLMRAKAAQEAGGITTAKAVVEAFAEQMGEENTSDAEAAEGVRTLRERLCG